MMEYEKCITYRKQAIIHQFILYMVDSITDLLDKQKTNNIWPLKSIKFRTCPVVQRQTREKVLSRRPVMKRVYECAKADEGGDRAWMLA